MTAQERSNLAEIKKTKQEIQSLENIDPPWAGIERSVAALIVWAAIIFLIAPAALYFPTKILFERWGLDLSPYGMRVLYGVSIAVAGFSVLSYFHSRGRFYRVVGSNKAIIFTKDIPGTSARERDDALERQASEGTKIKEGLHFLFPTDQEFTECSIDADINVTIPDFRVSSGKPGVPDLLVKGSSASFETDPNKLMRWARLGKTDAERKLTIETELRPIIKRIIEQETRAVTKSLGDHETPLDHTQDIELKVENQILDLLEERSYYGVRLKKVALGNVDEPEDVEKARDTAVAHKILHDEAKAATDKINQGLDPRLHVGPKEQIESALIMGKHKESKAEQKVVGLDQTTASTAVLLAEVFAKAFMGKMTPTAPPAQTPTDTNTPENN